MLDTSGVTLSRSQGVKTGVSIKFICGVMYYPPSPAPAAKMYRASLHTESIKLGWRWSRLLLVAAVA